MARKGKNTRKRRPSVRALMSRNAKKERNIPYLEELQLALSHQAAGHLGQAEEILQRVLAHKSNHAMALKLLGRLYCDSGRVEQGIQCLERCVQCEPGELSNYIELGHVLRVTGRRDAAEQVLLKGIGLKSNDPQAHYELGCLYHDQTKLELASAELNLALKLNPDHIAARQRLGEVHQALGQSSEAEACFRRVITKSPHDPEAHRGLAYLKRFTEYSPDIQSMEASYEKSSEQGMDRVVLAFSLGKVFEDLERYDEAFAHYEEANRLHRSLYQFSIDLEAAYFETYREAFTSDWLTDPTRYAIEDATPIFVIGMPRSGTSLVEQILASHSSARITDKLPHNFLRVGLLTAVMPQARIIHCVRDPMDTCLSIFTHFFSSAHGYASDLTEVGRYYSLYERLMQDWEARFPGCMYRISYEDLVANHEREIKQLLEYCGLPFEPGCLRFHETMRAVNTPSAVQVRQPLYQSAVSRWKRYETHLQPLRAALTRGDETITDRA